jgi:chromosome segregation ATPase
LKKANEKIQSEAVHINEEFKKAKSEISQKLAIASKEAPLDDENHEPTKLKEELDSLGVDDLNELQVALEEYVVKANLVDNNPDVIRQYETTKREIHTLQEQLNSMKSSKDSKALAIGAISQKWEDKLDTHIKDVKTLFSKYMAEMSFTGEVDLYKGTDAEAPEGEKHPRNYKDWGIKIKVSFREGSKAQVLSAQQHSGGERSVSTILYLMALQDRMVAPFRCVDEINQGLDERNERLVFRRIVKNSCRPPKSNPLDHSGQYFLITPKLLPNLTDMETEGTTILFVMNGKLLRLIRCIFSRPLLPARRALTRVKAPATLKAQPIGILNLFGVCTRLSAKNPATPKMLMTTAKIVVTLLPVCRSQRERRAVPVESKGLSFSKLCF